MIFENSIDYARSHDSEEPLKNSRDLFHIPKHASGKDAIYFAGNSLGLQPKSLQAWVEQELHDWQRLGVEGHFDAQRPWVSYHRLAKESLGRLVGASDLEVIAMNTLTVNLHALFISFYRPTPSRYKVLTMRQAFPSDHYAVCSQIKLHGYDPKEALIEVGPDDLHSCVDEQEIERTLEKEGDQIALIWLEGVNYMTGQKLNLKKIAQWGHRHGCYVGFDLAHAIGNVALDLHSDDIDFAVWCSYKYLNGGPGCTGGAFVHDKHAHAFDFPLMAGWWGHDESRRFLMEKNFQPMPGVDRWQVSNIPVLTTTCLLASLALFDQFQDRERLSKSARLTAYLEYLLIHNLGDDVKIITPTDPSERGCQLSISLKTKSKAKEIFQKIMAKGLVCDWREPNIIRMAPVPLYNTFEDVYQAACIIKESM